MKGDNGIFVFIVIILIVLGLGYFYNPDFFKNLLGDISSPFFYDPYLIEDDFTMPSPAIVCPRNPIYCTETAGSWNCKDNKWESTGQVHSGSGYGWSTRVCAENNNLNLIGETSQGSMAPTPSIARYLVNLKNKDIKIKVQSSWGGTISLNENGVGLQGLCNYDYSRHQYVCSSNDYLIEFIKDVTDKNKFVAVLNGEPIKEFIIEKDEAYLSFNGLMSIDYIKSQPYFSCQTDNNEVWVSDNFGEGSTFDIHSLTYEPTKFCPQDYPAVVRDFRERGVKADYRGTITERLTRGEKFTVPTFQSYEIRYATTYKEGMGARCGIDEVFYVDKAKGISKCVKKIYEQDYIIKDCNTNPEICPSPNICKDINNAYVCMGSQTIFRDCNTNPEICPSPNTCQLKGGVYTCVTTVNTIKDCNTNPEICPSPNICKNINGVNICASSTTIIAEKNCATNPEICDKAYGEYCDITRVGFPVCVRPYKVVEIIRDREIIQVGKNQKSFVNNIIIGDTSITSSKPSFTCGGNENQNSPYPRADCWRSSVSFDGKSYTMKDGDEIDLNDYLKLKLHISALYHQECEGENCRMVVKDSATNNLILTIKNFNFIQTEIIKGNELDYYALKDKSKEMCFKIINNLGINFNSEQSGYSLKKTTDLITMQTTGIEPKSLPSGAMQFCIPIDTARYGEIFYQINPYIKIGDEMFFDDEQIVYNYKIVDEVPANETVVYKTIYEYKTIYAYLPSNASTTPSIETPTKSNWLLYTFIGLCVVFILTLLYKSKN